MAYFSRFIPVVAVAFVAGCASFAPYNAALEQRVIRMDERTHELLAVSRKRAVPLAESQSFLRDSLSTLEWMHENAERYGSQGPEVETAENLRMRFAMLQAGSKPLRRADLIGSVGSTAALRAVYYRSPSKVQWFSAPPEDTTSATNTDTTTTTTDSTKCKDVRHNHDRGRCDDGRHGGHDGGHRH